MYWKLAHDRRQATLRKLVAAVVARLQQQCLTAQEDTKGLTTRWMAVPQLRDEIQADVDDLKTRKKVWAKVEQAVESNVNVRSRQTDNYGEIMRVWEWVGEI